MDRAFDAVIFDIDGTLTPEISWTKLTRDLGASVEAHDDLHRRSRMGHVSYEESKAELLALWRGTGNANRAYMERLFRTWPLREGAKEVMAYLSNRGYVLCLITGSVDLYARVIAERLGAPHFFANARLVWDESGRLADFHYRREQGRVKFEQFVTFCRDNGVNPKRCVAVGDDSNDVELFTFTGHGIAVHSPTSHRLEHVAWKKIRDLRELTEIL